MGYKRESSEVVVDAECIVDWGYKKRNEIPVEEAEEGSDSIAAMTTPYEA